LETRSAERNSPSAFCSYTRTTINFIWNALVSRLAAMIGVSAASVNAAGFWECYAEIEPQQVAAGQSVACGEFASGDFTSGHPSFVPHGVNHGLSLWCGVRMLCPMQGCEMPGVHS